MRPRDPRFDETSGSYDVDGFTKAYAFLEEYRTEELEKLKEAKQKLNTKKRRKMPQDRCFSTHTCAQCEPRIKCRIQQDKQRKHLGELRAAELSLKSKEREKVKTTGKAVGQTSKTKLALYT
ncbi:rRNA biogenesis protein RRP36 (Ribosomal RNA-processing protein 36) [Durusdinium trenchii]|uniref:rRNA biogenesis protein RRP36 n=1 Tax=Durusdinium trenchii TaxID=1381693 RepID=A0ABP0MXR8_9DINO